MFLCCRKNYYKTNDSFYENIINYEVSIYDLTNKKNVIILENITINKAKNILLFLNNTRSYFHLKNIYDERLYKANKKDIDEILKLNIHRGVGFFSNTIRYNLIIECLKSIVNHVQYKNKTDKGFGFLGTNKNRYVAQIRRKEYLG